MANAILNGKKTVMRKPIKGTPTQACPYGEPGTRLWLKEDFYAYGIWESRQERIKQRKAWRFKDLTQQTGRDYRFTMPDDYQKLSRDHPQAGWWLRPAVTMPRRASRVEIEITQVHIERLRDITDEQAQAEGFSAVHDGVHTYYANYLPAPRSGLSATPVIAFATYWQNVYGNESWIENPWVWVVGFRSLASSANAAEFTADADIRVRH
ncbi:hypothetical protein BZK31_14215 [Pseudomonas floridensis]|uniref:Uncharacterized protein n=2 Tax=Pseudomonas floridensis TaxID=1958950 RepID=A0A1X0N6X3_9PSED|nr:hypothetical protein BZK31_14215 [Pseudomonas floridensis]